MIRIISALLFIFMLMGSHTALSQSNRPTIITDSVTAMMQAIARDVTANGPVAWITYFENTPGFYMASDGQLAFPNYDSAKSMINNSVAKNIRHIELTWRDIRIAPMADQFVGIASFFHENITDASDKLMSVYGYFTATAHYTTSGWKLYNMHWSIMH